MMPAQTKTLRQAAQAFAAPKNGLAAACSCHCSKNSPEIERLVLAAHRLDVRARQLAAVHDDAAQLALALAGLVTEQVLLAGLPAFQFPRSRHAEAFLRGLVRLLLRHGTIHSLSI